MAFLGCRNYKFETHRVLIHRPYRPISCLVVLGTQETCMLGTLSSTEAPSTHSYQPTGVSMSIVALSYHLTKYTQHLRLSFLQPILTHPMPNWTTSFRSPTVVPLLYFPGIAQCTTQKPNNALISELAASEKSGSLFGVLGERRKRDGGGWVAADFSWA